MYNESVTSNNRTRKWWQHRWVAIIGISFIILAISGVAVSLVLKSIILAPKDPTTTTVISSSLMTSTLPQSTTLTPTKPQTTTLTSAMITTTATQIATTSHGPGKLYIVILVNIATYYFSVRYMSLLWIRQNMLN
jgi:hypothetical protein